MYEEVGIVATQIDYIKLWNDGEYIEFPKVAVCWPDLALIVFQNVNEVHRKRLVGKYF